MWRELASEGEQPLGLSEGIKASVHLVHAQLASLRCE
jgi:hypothetical protein